MKIKFYPTSLISSTKGSFYNSKSNLNYLKKLAQEQGISFLVGIAVGVNLILLLQIPSYPS
jgi:hypothetical protein